MRNLLSTLLVTFGLCSCLGVGAASAYQLRLVPTTPTESLSIGDIVTYEVYLDTETPSAITMFSASLSFDPTIVQYRADLSAQNSYYPLYSPNTGKNNNLAWLEPAPFDGNYCSPGNELCSNPPMLWNGDQPAIGAQVNVEFSVAGAASATKGTYTNALLARLSFEAIAGGTSAGQWGFGHGGNVFNIEKTRHVYEIVDIKEQVGGAGPATMSVVIPEPTTALLLGVGLASLALARRRRG